MGAKGSPGTMNKEYQEATNEYLKVSIYILYFGSLNGGKRRWRIQMHVMPLCRPGKGEHGRTCANDRKNRHKIPNPSPVSRPKATKAKGKYRARRKQRVHKHPSPCTSPFYFHSHTPLQKAFSLGFLCAIMEGWAVMRMCI